MVVFASWDGLRTKQSDLPKLLCVESAANTDFHVASDNIGKPGLLDRKIDERRSNP